MGDDSGDEFVEGGGGGVLLLLLLFGIEMAACIKESYTGEEHGEDGLSSVWFHVLQISAYEIEDVHRILLVDACSTICKFQSYKS